MGRRPVAAHVASAPAKPIVAPGESRPALIASAAARPVITSGESRRMFKCIHDHRTDEVIPRATKKKAEHSDRECE